MLIQRVNIVGVDSVIDKLQLSMNKHFTLTLSDKRWDNYPRIYLNKRDEDFVFEHCLNGRDYLPLSFNDRIDLLTFWHVDEERNYSKGLVSQKIYFIVSCTLDNLEIQVGERADEELKRLFAVFFNKFTGSIELTRIVDGIDNVFKEVDKSQIKWSNLQPRHVVRFELDVKYQLKECCKDGKTL